MELYLMAGFISALTFYIIVLKIGIRHCVKYDLALDVFVTLALMWMFSGTITGMMTAVFAGVIFSGFMFISKIFVVPYPDEPDEIESNVKSN